MKTVSLSFLKVPKTSAIHKGCVGTGHIDYQSLIAASKRPDYLYANLTWSS